MNAYKIIFLPDIMAKVKVPIGTLENDSYLDSERPFPSIECLNKKEIGELEKRVNRIIDFHSESRLAFQAVSYVSNWISELGFEKRELLDDKPSKNKSYFYQDPWQKSSMLVVREGRKPITEGFHLVNSHADSPCLRVKPRPVRLEWDPDELWNYLGVRLSTIPHGGIIVPHWIGQPVDVMGYTIRKNGSRKEIKFTGFVGINSVHVDDSNEEAVRDAFSPEKSLEIITGFSNISSLLNGIGLKNLDDFANTRLWGVPTNQMFPVSEYDWNLLVGYGHDNRTSVFSAVDAIARTRNPEYTSIAWISDNEEIFEPAPAGTSGPFFRIFLDKMLEEQEKTEKRKISRLERANMYFKSRGITGDVTIAPYGKDANNMDFNSAAKIGKGVAIDGGDVQGSNPNFVRDLRNLALKSKTEKGICHQTSGQFYSQDRVELWYSGEGTHEEARGVPQIWAGIPCASCHSIVEVICPGDEYAASELYKRFFESK
jgi:aspartyl aminopeptidase